MLGVTMFTVFFGTVPFKKATEDDGNYRKIINEDFDGFFSLFTCNEFDEYWFEVIR